MSITEIMTGIEMIERDNLKYSLGTGVSIKELGERYKDLVILRNQLFNNPFLCGNIQEIETARFKIIENMLNLRILMKEKAGLNCTDDINQMKRLWNE